MFEKKLDDNKIIHHNKENEKVKCAKRETHSQLNQIYQTTTLGNLKLSTTRWHNTKTSPNARLISVQLKLCCIKHTYNIVALVQLLEYFCFIGEVATAIKTLNCH